MIPTEANGDWVLMETQLVRREQARIPIFDRGLLFGHSAYEVTAVVGGAMVDPRAHIERLRRTLSALDLSLPHEIETLEGLQDALIARNGLREGLIYLQVTAGDYGMRDFAGPDRLRPRLLGFCTHKSLLGEAARAGIAAISLPDLRWARRDLKTTQLLSQALAYRAARDAGAQTAIMHENGTVTEAASANVWMVSEDERLVTRDLSPAILAGVTRAAVFETGIKAEERAFTLDEARSAREIFTTSTGAMILPVVSLDGEPVGDGGPGGITRDIQRRYYGRIGLDMASRAAWLDQFA